VFLMVFFAMLAAALAYSDMPPGPQFYTMLNVLITDYLVLGIPATTLVIAVFNGVFYGILAWLAFTVLHKTGVIK